MSFFFGRQKHFGKPEHGAMSPSFPAYGRRFMAIALLIVFALSFIFFRTASLQLGGQEWDRVSLSRGKGGEMSLSAARGDIVDTNGVPLAYSEDYDSLYLAHTNLSERDLNRLLNKIDRLLAKYAIKGISGLDRYFAPSSQSDSEIASPESFVFKKDLDEIAAWQQNKDLFALASEASGKAASARVKLLPSDFYDYLLFDAFGIESRQAGGNRFYSCSEAYAIMRLRYQILEHNWTFVQGEPVKLAENIPEGLKAEIEEQNQTYPGTIIKRESRRRYTDSSRYFSHILGYVGAISSGEYERLKDYAYSMDDICGKAGVELTAERYLHGENGTAPYGVWTVDDDGQPVFKQGERGVAPVPGATVRLAQNVKLQKTLYASLFDTVEYVREHKLGRGRSAAAVMLDLKDGRILAMGSIPSFMPEDFLHASFDEAAAERVSKDLQDNERKPMQNRCISEIYAPGSTFKPITAAAGIMEGVIEPGNDKYECKGKEVIGYKSWVCFGEPEHGHGWISLAEGLVYSCNLYFFKLGLDTGIEAISRWAEKFGLGEYTGIDLPGEARGIRPSPALKAATRMSAEDQEWYPADTCQTSIGQFDNAYTLLQLVRAIGGVASNRLVSPHVIQDIRSADGRLLRAEQKESSQLGLSDTAIQMVREGMRQLKNYGKSNHTNQNFAAYPIDTASKTGTAEVGINDELVANAVFVLFAPTDHPEVAIACIVEEGGKGDVSSNIARDLLDAYYGLEPRKEIVDRIQEMEENPYRFFRNVIELTEKDQQEDQEADPLSTEQNLDQSISQP